MTYVARIMVSIEPDGEAVHGSCPDCGKDTRSVWGYISNDAGARAVYFIRWTDGHVERGAQLIVSIGGWGEGTNPSDRVVFGLEGRVDPSLAFMVVDAAELPWSDQEHLGAKLTRADALAHPFAAEVFGILDALVARDPRFRAFLDHHA
jgi:hypothetical protein